MNNDLNGTIAVVGVNLIAQRRQLYASARATGDEELWAATEAVDVALAELRGWCQRRRAATETGPA